METHKVQSLIHRIISGKQYLFYNQQRYVLKKPSIDLLLEADLIYQDTYNNHKYDHFLLLENVENLLIAYKICAINHKETINSLEKTIENTKKELFRNFTNQKEKTKNKKLLDQYKTKLNELYAKKHYLDFLTLEKHCENIRHEFIISNTLYDYVSGKLIFQYPDISDYDLFSSLIAEISNNIIDISTFKQLAISEYWRSYYSNNKNHVFSCSASEYSEEQKALINISSMYDNIYQHPECPSDKIIADEDALDGWMLIQKEKNNREKSLKGVNEKVGAKIANSQQVFLMGDGTEESNEDIMSLNTTEALRNIKQREELIKERGTVNEMDFTDRKQHQADYYKQVMQQKPKRK